MKPLLQGVLDSYSARRCFICEKPIACEHREFEVEKAHWEAEQRAAIAPTRRPPQSITRRKTA